MIKPDYRRARNEDEEQNERNYKELEHHRLLKFQARREAELHQRSDYSPAQEKGSPLLVWFLVGIALWLTIGAIVWAIFTIFRP